MENTSLQNAPGLREEICAACGNAFGCGIEASSCWCSEVSLTAEDLSAIAGRFEGCLCRKCLVRFANDPATPDLIP